MNRTKTSSRHFICCLAIAICCASGLRGYAQIPDSAWTDVSAIRFSKLLLWGFYGTTEKKPLTTQEVVSVPFKWEYYRTYHPNIPSYVMEKNFVMKFYLYNSASKKEEFYFSPGYYFRNIAIYKADPDRINASIQRLPDSVIHSALYGGAKLLTLDSGERAVFYITVNFIRTNANNFTPYLIEKDYLRSWMLNVKHKDPIVDVVTYTISGILLLMIFYSLSVYALNRSKEFLYYSIYALCSTMLFFIKSYSIFETGEWNLVYEEYLDFILLSTGVFFYLFFVGKFINTKEEHPALNKFLRIVQVILLALLLVFSVIYFATDEYRTLFIVENFITKNFMFLIGVVFVCYALGRRNKLLNYLAAGNLALIIFSILSLLIVVGIKLKPSDSSSIFNKGLLYYEVGVVLELAFFLMGLAYKNRRDLTERIQERERFKLETERKEFEKQIAIVTTRQEERDRISADMHDELGSGMTAIRLMSEIVKTKMKDQSFPELEKISNSANDLLGKMNSIIWTMKSSNDTLESLVAYLRSHALEYFESTPITCRVHVPDVIPPTEMSGEKRRNIFLSVKESLNNIMKHAQATEVTIQINIVNKELHIIVSDNGVGIDTEKLRRFGNGLSNMKRRMESINGDFKVETNGGSVITFISPL